MKQPYRQITVEHTGDVACVRLRHHRLDEAEVLEFAEEASQLIIEGGCRKMILSLGPGEVGCLYSVFLAKLVMIRRQLVERGGQFKIAEASPATIGIFEACHLKDYFQFHPTVDAAVAAFDAAR
jgi:anti-anti-sigma factor